MDPIEFGFYRTLQTNVTPRELQVLHLVANDYTSREVAHHLQISAETVKSHRGGLIRKLGVKTTGGMIKRGFELGLLHI